MNEAALILGRMEAFALEPHARHLRLEDIGHAFRGSFLDRCSLVERWSAEILALYAAKPKHQLLFGQKLALVRKIAAENVAGRGTPKFKKPQRVLDLLERLEPFAALRCSLAHAVQTVRIRSDGQAVFLYQSIGRPPSLAVALTEAAQRNMLSQLTRIAKQITDQRARPA